MATISTPFNKGDLPSDKITIFDMKVNERAPHTSVSPSTRSVINAALVKNVPFHLEPIEMIDIPTISQAIGAKPTRQDPPFYTVPALYDPKTNTVVSDSWDIIQYLDQQYGDSPPLAQSDAQGLVEAFKAAYAPIDRAISPFALPNMLKFMIGTKSEAHYREVRSKSYGGRDLETLAPTGEEAENAWIQIKTMFNAVDAWYKGRVFIMGGDSPTYTDLFVAGRLWSYRSMLGVESEDWKRIASWNGGRWATLIAYFDDRGKEICVQVDGRQCSGQPS